MTTSAREQSCRLADLLRREHSAMADFLLALAGFDSNRAWEQLGHPSLFSFLRRELRLSAGAAQYRKTAAELVQRYPAIEAALRAGDLCLSSVIELAKVVTPENVTEILPRFFGLSARDAAFVAVSIRPVENPPVRDFLVTPVRLDPPAVTPSAAQDAESSIQLRTSEPPPGGAPALAPVAPVRPSDLRDRPVVKPLDGERARVNMTVPRRLLEKLAAARDALSHSHPGASEEQIIELGLDLLLERAAKRKGLVANPRATPRSTTTAAIPAAVKREVWKRAGGRCEWPLDGGGVCGSRLRPEFDHIVPKALGGPATVANVRLTCRRHNQLAARQVFGDDHMDQFTRPRSPPEAPPPAP